jgi:hypothetical protein
MKMEALTSHMQGDKGIKKVYLLNQDIRSATRSRKRHARC